MWILLFSLFINAQLKPLQTEGYIEIKQDIKMKNTSHFLKDKGKYTGVFWNDSTNGDKVILKKGAKLYNISHLEDEWVFEHKSTLLEFEFYFFKAVPKGLEPVEITEGFKIYDDLFDISNLKEKKPLELE